MSSTVPLPPEALETDRNFRLSDLAFNKSLIAIPITPFHFEKHQLVRVRQFRQTKSYQENAIKYPPSTADLTKNEVKTKEAPKKLLGLVVGILPMNFHLLGADDAGNPRQGRKFDYESHAQSGELCIAEHSPSWTILKANSCAPRIVARLCGGPVVTQLLYYALMNYEDGIAVAYNVLPDRVFFLPQYRDNEASAKFTQEKCREKISRRLRAFGLEPDACRLTASTSATATNSLPQSLSTHDTSPLPHRAARTTRPVVTKTEDPESVVPSNIAPVKTRRIGPTSAVRGGHSNVTSGVSTHGTVDVISNTRIGMPADTTSIVPKIGNVNTSAAMQPHGPYVQLLADFRVLLAAAVATRDRNQLNACNEMMLASVLNLHRGPSTRLLRLQLFSLRVFARRFRDGAEAKSALDLWNSLRNNRVGTRHVLQITEEELIKVNEAVLASAVEISSDMVRWVVIDLVTQLRLIRMHKNDQTFWWTAEEQTAVVKHIVGGFALGSGI